VSDRPASTGAALLPQSGIQAARCSTKPAAVGDGARANGRVVQEAHIGEETIWGPHYVIADVARHLTLLAGDVILMGTPCHSRSIDPGDVVACEITGLGCVAGTLVGMQSHARKRRRLASARRRCPR